jgi:hypothetical protein
VAARLVSAVRNLPATEPPAATAAPPDATVQTAATAPDIWENVPENARRAIQSLQSGQSLPDAIEAAYGVSRRNPNKYGPAYEEVQAALRRLVPAPGEGV